MAGSSLDQTRGAMAGGSNRSAGDVLAWGNWADVPAGGSGDSGATGGCNSRRANGGDSRGRGRGRWAAALGGSNMGAARGCSQCSGEIVREGRSNWESALSVADGLREPLNCQTSKFRSNLSCGYAHAPVAGGGGLSDTQPHPLPGLCVVTAGLSVCAVPIVGLCHHCWGEGTPLMWDCDPATVDCWQFYSTCHCLQRSRQFELGAREVCTRAGAARGRVSCSSGGHSV